MKKLIFYNFSSLLFMLGDLISRILHIKIKNKYIFDFKILNYLGDFLFLTYQFFMNKSSKIQELGGDGPWKNFDDKDCKYILTLIDKEIDNFEGVYKRTARENWKNRIEYLKKLKEKIHEL